MHMARPKKRRTVAIHPSVSYFKPRGIPMLDLEEVQLTVDEREALRLADLNDLSHAEAGRQMDVSRATFGRIIQNARRVLSDALINGKAIRIEGGNYRIVSEKRMFVCNHCQTKWNEPRGTGRPAACPSCGNGELFRVDPEGLSGKSAKTCRRA